MRALRGISTPDGADQWDLTIPVTTPNWSLSSAGTASSRAKGSTLRLCRTVANRSRGKRNLRSSKASEGRLT
jgi:hypothetical protein